MPDTACLTEAQLVAFQVGELSDVEMAEVTRHLENCRRCEAAARLLDEVADPVIAALRQAPPARTPALPTPPLTGQRTVAVATPAKTAVSGSGLPRFVADYEILSELGRGGAGVVYKARQPRLNRIVALKIILAGTHATTEQLVRFLFEAETVARLSHPYIVQIHEVGEHNGQPFLALEYIDGGTLDGRIRAEGWPARRAAALVEQLARATQHAHQLGVVHRDLKPGNVLLTADGCPKITDFGLAKQPDAQLTASGVVMGTPSYMAPEQARGDGGLIGPAADVYALGAILYELLTGRPPFDGATPLEILRQVTDQDPPSLTRFRPGLPRDLSTICKHCLEKEPARRYASAQALADDLRHFLQGEPIQARSVSPAERAWKWARRRPAVAALVLVSFVTLLSLGAVVTGRYYNARLQLSLEETAQAKEQAERFRYFHLVGLAEAEWRGGSLGQAELLLDDCPAEQRHWEWHYLKRLCRSYLLAFHGHSREVFGVAYSPDGTRLASAGGDGAVKIWDVIGGQLVRTLEGHNEPVRCVAFNRDGRRLASAGDNAAGDDGGVRLWDVATGRLLRKFPDPRWYRVTAVAFSPDDTCLASASHDGLVRVWEPETGVERHRLRGSGAALFCVAFHPDGTRLASGGKTIRCGCGR